MASVCRRSSLALLAAVFLLSGCFSSDGELDSTVIRDTGIERIFFGPRFWTGDPEHPWTEGLAVDRHGRVVARLDQAGIRKAALGGATLQRLAGSFAVPGLVDAHAHLLGYATSLDEVSLVGTESLDETLERIRRWARERPDEIWLRGRGWDQNDWDGRAWPRASDLDRILPARPGAFRRVDGHALWVNSAALEAAGIDRDTPDPPGGRIERDEHGHPIGILVDTAMSLVSERIPPRSAERIEHSLKRALDHLLAVGLTGVHDMGTDLATWEVLTRLVEEGDFPLRVTAYASADSALAQKVLEEGPIAKGNVRLAGIKFYADGALGSRGARLLAPYADEPGTQGLWVTDPKEVRRKVGAAWKAGVQPAVHAIGDAAVREVLDIYTDLLGVEAAGDRPPPRIEHAQNIDARDLPRWGERKIVASMQPTHATSDMPWAEARLGAERISGAYAWRGVLDAGGLLAFGSDFPVEDIDPRKGLYSAVSRQDEQGRPEGGWIPEQRLRLEEALRAFTRAAALAAGSESSVGSLAPGRFCDVTVFADDLFEIPPRRLLDTQVTETIIAGRVVWSAARAAERSP